MVEKNKETMKMMKMTVSGSFKTSPGTDKDRCNFADLKGLVEFSDYEYYYQIAERMLPIWLAKSTTYKRKNFEGRIKIYVDDVVECEGTPECLHKDIKEMTWEELMSLACYAKIREIPLYKRGDLRKAQEKAYLLYEEKVNGKTIIRTKKDLNKLVKKAERKLEINGEMVEGGEISQSQLEEALKSCINTMQDAVNPLNSYNFAKLPSLFIDGK